MKYPICSQCKIVWVSILVFIFLAGVPLVQAEPGPITDPEPVITAEIDTAESDKKIRSRIENIFAELDTLSAVAVSVKEGVVTLRGEVANELNAQQAQRLAIRLAGVVTVEDEISRTLAVVDNVRPVIESFRTHALDFVKALPLIGLALLVVVIFTVISSFIARRKTLWKKLSPNPFLAELLAQAVRLVIVVLGVITALNLLGAASVITTILGGAGVLGLAIGFAVRDTMENYISSIMLSLRQPFRAKDHVIINDLEGIVVRLTSRATILMTLDGNHLRIPNASVFKGIILNYSTNPERRFEFELGVDAADDPVTAMKVGLDAIRALDFILTEPEPVALIKTVGDSNIELSFYAWIDQRQTNFAKARSLSIRAAMQVLEKQGFTLPEPIYRLRFDERINTTLMNRLGGEAGSVVSKTHKSIDELPANTAELDEDYLDVSPDKHLQQKVEEEIKSDQDTDLLNADTPQE